MSSLLSCTKDLQQDISRVQRVGGYAYGFSYGCFVLFIFLAAVCAERKRNKEIVAQSQQSITISENENETAQTQPKPNQKRMHRLYLRCKSIGKTMMRLRSIYFIILVHIFDTLTDFLIMLEWFIKGSYERSGKCEFPSINYTGCFICACIILLFYRILSAHYVYKYYQQSTLKAIVQTFLQFLDISIFYEVYHSHLHQSATDNLSYLSKLEKTFESSPQLILQLYVLMRELAQPKGAEGVGISEITIVSILFSLVSLASKVISDDEHMFFKEANKKYKLPFFGRALFRICEISARLLAITLFATFFGANFLVLVVLLDLITNLLMFDHGLLDSDPLNCMSYLLCTMNVGITSTTNHQLIKKAFMKRHPIFAKCWHCLFIFITRLQFIVVACSDTKNAHYYLSYYLIRSKCIQSFIILLVITCISILDLETGWHFDCKYICTDQDDRAALYDSTEFILFVVFAYIAVLCAYFMFTKVCIKYMKAGMILDRSPWILFINFNFFDAIRAYKERNGPHSFKLNEELRRIIQENARLPSLHFVPQNASIIFNTDEISATNIKNEVIDTYSQLPYLITELNDLQNVDFIYELLEYAILKLHDNFLSFFLSPYVVDAMHNFDPISYKNRKNGQNLLETAINRQNNVIIKTVFYNCPDLLKANDYASFIQLWNEKYIATIDFMIENDKSLLEIQNPETKQSIFFYCIDQKYHTMITMLLSKMRPDHFDTLLFYQCNILIYAIQSNNTFVLDAIKDRVDWNTTFQHVDGGLMVSLTFQLHAVAFAIFHDDHVTLTYLLNTKQGAALVNTACICTERKDTNFNWAKKKEQEAEEEKKDTNDDASYSMTPLMIATMKAKPLLMQILLYHGADTSIKTERGKTARDFWPHDLDQVPDALKLSIKEDSDAYKGILKKFVDPKTQIMEDLTIMKNKTRLEQLLIAEQLRQNTKNKLNITDYEVYQLFEAKKLSKEQRDHCEAIKSQSANATHVDSMITAIDLYVRQLIQNDSNFALNVLVQKISLETIFDPYLMNLRGERVDWRNSFIRLCIRYNATKLLNDMLHYCAENKLKEIVKLEMKNSTNRKKLAPLFYATSVELCQILYDIGFDIKPTSFDPLRSLIYHHSKKKHYKIVQWLIYNGSTLRKGVKYSNILIEACANGLYHCLPVLIPLCDIETLKKNQESLLHYAIESCNITTVQMIMKNGFDDINNITNADGKPALHFAWGDTENKDYVSQKHPTVVLVYHLLFNLNFDINVTDKSGDTALHIAVQYDMYRLKLILSKLCRYPDAGIEIINMKNKDGLTPLQIALKKGKVTANIIQILLKTNKCVLEGMLEYCFNVGARNESRAPIFDMMVLYGAVLDKDKEEKLLKEMQNHEYNQWRSSYEHYVKFQKEKEENMKQMECDTYETFSIWNASNSKEKHEQKCEDDGVNEAQVQFQLDSELIRNYRDIDKVDDLECADDKSVADVGLGTDKNKEILDLCLAMMDNNDTSLFAESFFSDIIMHYMFDREWEILNTICAASQYEPILLKAFTHKKFKPNINSIICKHKNEENAQLIVESLTFSFGNRYIETKDIDSKKTETKNGKKDDTLKKVVIVEEEDDEVMIKSMTMIQNEENEKVSEENNKTIRECVEFIMRQTIYEKLQMVDSKTLNKKLSNYIEIDDVDKDIKQDMKEEEVTVQQVNKTTDANENDGTKLVKPLGPKPNFGVYDNMRKVGLPQIAIRQKMLHNRVEEYWIKHYFNEVEEEDTKKTNTNDEDQNTTDAEKSQISDQETEKYSKMIKCGIHPKHVADIMKRKGYDQKAIDLVMPSHS